MPISTIDNMLGYFWMEDTIKYIICAFKLERYQIYCQIHVLIEIVWNGNILLLKTLFKSCDGKLILKEKNQWIEENIDQHWEKDKENKIHSNGHFKLNDSFKNIPSFWR